MSTSGIDNLISRLKQQAQALNIAGIHTYLWNRAFSFSWPALNIPSTPQALQYSSRHQDNKAEKVTLAVTNTYLSK